MIYEYTADEKSFRNAWKENAKYYSEYFLPRFPEISYSFTSIGCVSLQSALVSYPKTEMTIMLFMFIEQKITVGRCFEIFHHMLTHRWKHECINWKKDKGYPKYFDFIIPPKRIHRRM